jgi:hypothetical protein
MPLSMLDKAIRLSLMTYPRTLGVSQFFPALSTYRVERPFSVGELKEAVSHFFNGNPFFSKCHLIERRFKNPDEFPLSSFQGVVIDEYSSYYDSFLLMSVTYESDPALQGIFTIFPISMQDGYMCFRFHQALMKTVKSGRDQFRIAETIKELRMETSDLAEYLPRKKSHIDKNEALRTVPFEIQDVVEPALKIGPYMDSIKEEFLARSCETLIVLKNASYASNFCFGDWLIFLRIPREVVARSTGIQIRNYYNAQEVELGKALASLERPEDFAKIGEGLIPEMLTHPGRFCVNNYGNVSQYDGSDLAPTKGVLIKYQWHMPTVVLGLMSGDGSGVDWTITINGKAFRSCSAPQDTAVIASHIRGLAPAKTGS